jgi:hypothetical protein
MRSKSKEREEQKVQLNYRFSRSFVDLLDRICVGLTEELGASISRSQAIEMAVREIAKKKGAEDK